MAKSIGRIGGKLVVDFYRARLKSDGSAHEWLDKLTDTAAPTPTTTNVALTINELVGTKPTPQDDGTYKIEWEQYESGDDIWAFLDKVAVPAASTSTKPDYNLQDGTKRGGSISATDLVVPIIYGFDDADTPTKVFVIAAAGGIDPASGAIELKNETYIAPTISFTGTKVTKALPLPAGLFRDDIVDSAAVASISIEAGKGFVRKFIALAA